MKVGISQKLFLVMIGTVLVAIISMALAVRYNFHHGFLAYINRSEINRINSACEQLAEFYDTNGSWQYFRRYPREGRRLLRAALREPGHQHRHHDMMRGEPPPPLAEVGLMYRVTLLDQNKVRLIGKPRDTKDSQLFPIVSNGLEVGWLQYTASATLTKSLDIQFQHSQFSSGLVISVFSILLSALVAYLLAQHFLKPIKQLVTAMKALSNGDFHTRTDIGTRDELGQLQQDFNNLANTLQQHERARQRWLADISHELRTPVAVLRGEIEALQDGVRKFNLENLQSLHNETMRIGNLIEDLYQLSLSDLGALDYHKETVNISSVLDEVINSFMLQCEKTPLQIRSNMEHGNIMVFADKKRLHQLFANLFQNSLRYTNPGGIVSIELELQEDKVVINWQDSDPGVQQEQLLHLFDPLYRVEASRDRRSGGAGLGLAIVKNIVLAHEGEILARPSPLGGIWIQIFFKRVDT